MKRKSIPLTFVYKVVQVANDGTMWSANPGPALVRFDTYGIEYKLRHQVQPLSNKPALFVVPDLVNAKLAVRIYGGIYKKAIILRCLAYNARVPKADGDTIYDNQMGWITVPSSFITGLCDWLIPLAVVGVKS